MTVTVNGESQVVGAAETVAAVVAALTGATEAAATGAAATMAARGVAVAVNGDVVPRSAWATTTLTDGDAVEVLTAVQGG